MRMRLCYTLILFITGEILIAIILYTSVWKIDTKRKEAQQGDDRDWSMRGQAMDMFLYEYYNVRTDAENTGLDIGPDTFFLNGKSLTVLSGALHYFRVHPVFWRDRLRKLRAMGANTVETYIPWNLHEPEKDVYDFGKDVSGTDFPFSEWLDIVRFIEMAKEEDLFVIIRPGPYICSEWDFGGLPSYLLSIPGIRVRTNDPAYLQRVWGYFDQLLPKLASLRIERGGPIIMFQLENEYGHMAEGSKDHLRSLKKKMQEHGIDGLFVTSDGAMMVGPAGSLIEDGVLMTGNFQDNVLDELAALKELQPDSVAMVMEFWTGWFDHWGERHSTRNVQAYQAKVYQILEFPASINLYMFHGGTNFGFMNGANQWRHENRIEYEPDTTSYDYDAILNENGDYTSKYFITRQLWLNDQIAFGLKYPEVPKPVQPVSYPTIRMTQQMSYQDIIESIPSEDRIESYVLQPMEMLMLPARRGKGDRGGQSYGYTLYRQVCEVNKDPEIQITGRVKDIAIVMVDNVRQTDIITSMKQIYDFGFWQAIDAKKRFSVENGTHTFDFLLENMGRNNFGYSLEDFDQKKGLFEGSVTFDGEQPGNKWSIFTLDFQPQWVNSLSRWAEYSDSPGELDTPTMFKFILNLQEGNVSDTYLDMRGWGKGVVFVNGFNIGRYFNIGPQLTLYIPAPLFKSGVNVIVVFEHYKHPGALQFATGRIYSR